MSLSTRLLQRCRDDHQLAGLSLFALLACAGIAPFMVVRALDGEWLRACIDAAVVVAIGAGVLWTWRTGRQTAAMLLVPVVSAGILAVAATGGLGGALWAYPFVAGMFMLAPRWVCVVCASGLIAAIAALPLAVGMPAPPTSFYFTSVLVAAFGFVAASLTEAHRLQLQQLATRDPLTGMGNRRTMELELAGIVAEHHASAAPAGIAVLDLDHFKRINDRHGHAAGDHVLVDFARIVQGCVRLRDRLYRMGGEEFVLVLPQTDAAGVDTALAKVQTELRHRLRGPEGAVSTSIGAALLRAGEDWRTWLARADAALYCAKRAGRNRTELDRTCESDRRADAPQYARA